MHTINIKELNETEAAIELEAENVMGGAWYAKFDGVDGSVAVKSTPKLAEAVCNGTF